MNKLTLVIRPFKAIYLITLTIAAAWYYGIGGILLIFLASLDIKPKD